MKKIVLTAICLAMFLVGNTQKLDFWLDAGLKIQTGFTALYNSNVTAGNKWDNTLATGTKIGGKIGFNWNYIGVTLDVMSGKMRGKYQQVGTNPSFEREVSVAVTDLYLLFRSARHKGYFEIGPKYSLVGDITDNQDNSPNIEDSYEDKNIAAVLGFGTYILGPEDGRFSGIFGLRLEYGFQDLVNTTGRTEGLLRQPANYDGEAGTTNPIFVGIVFEFNWGIGGVGQARCGERSKFMWF